MRSVTTAATLATRIAVIAAAGGGLLLVVIAVIEMLGHPGTSIFDGYWIGPAPWTEIAIGLLLFGATAVVVLGSVAIWTGQGWLTRAVTLPALVTTAGWWGLSPFHGMGGACCGPVPDYDPITIAYSMPDLMLLLVIIPAIVVGALAILSMPRSPAIAPLPPSGV